MRNINASRVRFILILHDVPAPEKRRRPGTGGRARCPRELKRRPQYGSDAAGSNRPEAEACRRFGGIVDHARTGSRSNVGLVRVCPAPGARRDHPPSGDEARPQGLRHRLGFRVDVELPVDAPDVVAHGIHRDAELSARGLVAVPLAEEFQQAHLVRGQALVLPRRGVGALEQRDDLAGDLGGHRRSPFVRLADRLDEAGRRRVLQEVTARAVADRLEDLVLLGEDGQHEDLHGGKLLPQEPHPLRSKHPRKVDVEEEDVGGIRGEGGQSLLDGAEGPGEPVARRGRDEGRETRAERLVVLDDRDGDPLPPVHDRDITSIPGRRAEHVHAPPCRTAGPRSHRSVTDVPAPAALTIRRSPPISAARARRLGRPCPPLATTGTETSGGSNPRPSSRTSARRRPPSTRRFTSTRRQAECLAALFTASFRIRYRCRRVSGAIASGGLSAGDEIVTATPIGSRSPRLYCRRRATTLARSSRRGSIDQTMSLIDSTSERAESPMSPRIRCDSAASRTPGRRTSSLWMAMRERLAPRSSWRSAAMRVRTRSTSRRRRTRRRWRPMTMARAAAAARKRNHPRCQTGRAIEKVTDAETGLPWPSLSSAWTEKRYAPGARRAKFTARVSEGALQPASAPSSRYWYLRRSPTPKSIPTNPISISCWSGSRTIPSILVSPRRLTARRTPPTRRSVIHTGGGLRGSGAFGTRRDTPLVELNQTEPSRSDAASAISLPASPSAEVRCRSFSVAGSRTSTPLPVPR